MRFFTEDATRRQKVFGTIGLVLLTAGVGREVVGYIWVKRQERAKRAEIERVARERIMAFLIDLVEDEGCASLPCDEHIMCPDMVGERYCIHHCAHSHTLVDGQVVA